MHQGLSISRLWLAVILALFCLPLFVGLGRGDLKGDEASYSFGVDRLLESGDWLAPKASPHEDLAFLEKPPLKFWIVGIPMRLGLVPHTEFGMRFWDALFGAIAFVYVFAIGSRLAGAPCGAIAVLILFTHEPLLFEHGLRTNNMEAALFLSYCGGVFHYLEWVGGGRLKADTRDVPTDTNHWHAYAVGLYFVLGFMTKFVAALFLPVLLAVASLVVRSSRVKLVRAWRTWARAAALVLALCTPWFVYANMRFGAGFWRVMLVEHVGTRFTSFLDPEHVNPWYYYPYTMYQRFVDSGVELLVAGSLVLLIVQTIRRKWVAGAVVVSWFVVPVFLISLGTSKLYHYAYPFLPPLALACGYFAALVLTLAPVPFSRGLRALDEFAALRMPRLVAALRHPAVRTPLLTLAAGAVGLAVVSLTYGPVRIDVAGTEIFKSSGVFRPAVVTIVCGVLAGAGRGASRAVVMLTVASLLPLAAYRATLPRLTAGQDPKRAASECILQVQARTPGLPRGLYLDLPDSAILHPLYYYFRRVRPWTRAELPSPDDFLRYLHDPTVWRPILVWGETYQAFRRHPGFLAAFPGGSSASQPTVVFSDDVLLALPAPYTACSSNADDFAFAMLGAPDGSR